MAYAVVPADVRYVETSALFVGGELLGKVPRLAIAHAFSSDELLLLHCNARWRVLGVSGNHRDLEAAKARAERSYPGLRPYWVDTGVSSSEADALVLADQKPLACSFCGRVPIQVDTMFAGHRAHICSTCIREMHTSLSPQDEREA